MAISDARLAKMAEEYSELRGRAKALEAKANKRKEKILKELERRGTKAIETDEVRITRAQKNTVIYDPDALKERLGSSRFTRITKRVVDKELLAAAVQAGKVKVKDVEACSEVKPNAPYIIVSPRGDS